MPIYTVHVPSGVADDAARADGTVFVRQGFAWGAFLVGPLALLHRGLWRATLVWLLAAAALLAAAIVLGLGALPRFLLYLVLAALTGLEAAQARVGSLDRAGFIPAGIVVGRTRDAAERRFFGGQHPFAAPLPTRRAGGSSGRPPSVIGLFPPSRGRA